MIEQGQGSTRWSEPDKPRCCSATASGRRWWTQSGLPAGCCSAAPPVLLAVKPGQGGGAIRRCAIVLVHAAGLATRARATWTSGLLVRAPPPPPLRRAAPHSLSLSNAVVAWRLSSSSCPLHSLASFVRFARHDELTTLETMRSNANACARSSSWCPLAFAPPRFSPRGWTRLPFVRQCREGGGLISVGSFALERELLTSSPDPLSRQSQAYITLLHY